MPSITVPKGNIHAATARNTAKKVFPKKESQKCIPLVSHRPAG